MVLEKTLGSPLDCKEIKPVNPKGNQSWILIGKTDAEAETNTLTTWCKELTHWKRLWCWERLRVWGEGNNRGWDGWRTSQIRWTWVWATPGVGERQGSMACCSPWDHKELDMTEWLNWAELNPKQSMGSMKSLSNYQHAFHRTGTNTFTICIETQKASNSQNNLEKEKWNWRNHTFWLQTILQSYSHPDSMVLAQRQKYRSMVHNRKSRDKSTHLSTLYLWGRKQKHTIEERQSLQQMVLGNLVNHM